MGHVNLGSLAPTNAGANVVPNTVTMSLAPRVPQADMGKMGAGCRRKRMGRAGTRCFCDGKLVKSNRCK